MAVKKRQFSKEFKAEAVSLSYERENIKELASELDIQVARIYKWRTADRISKESTRSVKQQDSEEVKDL